MEPLFKVTGTQDEAEHVLATVDVVDERVTLRISPSDDPSDAIQIEADAGRVRELLEMMAPRPTYMLPTVGATLVSTSEPVRIYIDELTEDIVNGSDDLDSVMCDMHNGETIRYRQVLEVAPEAAADVEAWVLERQYSLASGMLASARAINGVLGLKQASGSQAS